MTVSKRLVNDARNRWMQATARDLMTPNPRCISQSATIREAAEYLNLTGASGAPVIDEAGRPVGVLSRTDILRHLGRNEDMPLDLSHAAHDPSERASLPVKRIMTRGVFCVRPGTPAAKVIAKLTALQVRRLFVVDGYGVLVGMIDAFTLLNQLTAPRLRRETVHADDASLQALAT